MKKLNTFLFGNLRKFGTAVFFLFTLIISVLFSACFTAGTHGSIKTYPYPVSKYVLQKAVNDVLEQDFTVQIAPVTDTFNSKYYNDGERYVTIQIKVSGGVNRYVFQYSGDKEYWDTSKISEISIAYAFDNNNNGGSEGDGKFSSYKPEIRRKLIDVFENEFINKIDLVLKKSM